MFVCVCVCVYACVCGSGSMCGCGWHGCDLPAALVAPRALVALGCAADFAATAPGVNY
jgi:hypothetical protein